MSYTARIASQTGAAGQPGATYATVARVSLYGAYRLPHPGRVPPLPLWLRWLYTARIAPKGD
jgi:hypothetical protein